MDKWLTKQIIAFALRQLAAYGTSINWAQVKADAHARLQTVVPKWLVGGLNDLIDKVLDSLATVLQDQADLSALVGQLAAQDWAGALTTLQAIFNKVVPSPVAHEAHMKAAIAEELAAA